MSLGVNFDQNQASLPPGFVVAVNYVVSLFNSLFFIATNITIDVGFGEIAGQTLLSGAIGESDYFPVFEPYSSVRGALVAEHAPGSGTLPTNVPGGVASSLTLTPAEAKVLGLIANNSNVDGYVGFDSTPGLFDYSITGTPRSNEYYFVGVVEHEFSEVMGRVSVISFSGDGPIDLYRFSSPGVRQVGSGNPSYFSIDSGSTNLDNFNNFVTGDPMGDLGDWASSAGNDVFLADGNTGVIDALSASDFEIMSAIGWETTPIPNISAATNTGVPGGRITSNTHPVVTGRGEPGETITLAVDGVQVGTTTVGLDDKWSIAAGTLTIGSHTISTNESGGAGVQEVVVTSFIIANTPGICGDFFNIGSNGQTVFFTSPFVAGQLDAYEYDLNGKLIGAAGFTNAGAPFVTGSGTTVVGGGEDYFGLGAGQHTIFLGASNGQLQAWEFNGLNQASGAAGFTNAGAAFAINSGTTVIGGGQDYFGLGAGEHAVFLRTSTGQLQAWEFNSLNQATGAAAFTNAGQTLSLDSQTSIIGAGEDVFRTGQHDMLVRDGAGELLLWQFNGSNQMTAYVGLSYLGAPFIIDSGSSVTGAQINPSNGREEIAILNGSGLSTFWDLVGTSLTNPH